MKKLIVYFHGYGSSPKSDKVARLRQEPDFNVHAFNIDIDPVFAEKHLTHWINMCLVDNIHLPEKLVFVGTSLGGWWAKKMAKQYKCKAVIINPSVDPANSLIKYGIAEEVLSGYHLLAPYIGDKYFFAEHDEVIDNVEFRNNLIDSGYDVTVVKNADHRFGGDAFEKVVSYLKTL